MNQTQTMPRPRGFTLIELLVVMTIIGILMAILVPAIYYARLAAQNLRISTEIANLSNAMEEYKNYCGDYGPTFDNVAVLERHLSKRQRITGPQITALKGFVSDPTKTRANNVGKIDPAEALPFWLGAASTNGGLHNNPVEPFQTGTARNGEVKSFFEFDQTRLVDSDGDGWLEYATPGASGVPYVYFEARSYNPNGAQAFEPYKANPFDLGSSNGVTPGKTAPYFASATTYQQPTKFQIISSGLDGFFGVGGQLFPSGPFPNEERDNLANFSEGKTFQDSVP